MTRSLGGGSAWGRLTPTVALLAFTALSGCNLIGMTTTRWEGGAEACAASAPEFSWPTAGPGEVGLDADILEASVRPMQGANPANLHSVVVVRDGTIVFERYFRGADNAWGQRLGEVEFEPDTLHDLRSVSKSVVGALVGIAHGDGALPDLDAPLSELLPGYRDRMEPKVARITLRHLLTMSAGLEWDELSVPYWLPWNDETAMWRDDDPVGFALTRAAIADAGARFDYNGGLPTLLAAIVERHTGTPIDRYAAERLFCPLGIEIFEWVRHPSGLHVAASGLRLRPRDLARFGWMMLDEGRFAGRQIVPRDYARASLAAHLETGSFIAPAYGYQWWVNQVETRSGQLDVPSAIGNGGQRIFVLRPQRTVVVVTAGNYDEEFQGEAPRAFLDAVIEAARGPS